MMLIISKSPSPAHRTSSVLIGLHPNLFRPRPFMLCPASAERVVTRNEMKLAMLFWQMMFSERVYPPSIHHSSSWQMMRSGWSLLWIIDFSLRPPPPFDVSVAEPSCVFGC